MCLITSIWLIGLSCFAEELLEEKEDEEAALPLVGHLLQLPGSPQKVDGENSTPPKMA